MHRIIHAWVAAALARQVPATGLSIFRILFGIMLLQEIIFLIYFHPLVFDPIPYIQTSSPLILFFLLIWAIVAIHLIVGRHTRAAARLNYVFWVVFVVFTPMWRDFDGGFDQLMTGTSFLLMFLPLERALSLDNLRFKLRHQAQADDPPRTVPVFCYYAIVLFSLGLLYFDSAVHKLFAGFWRNGMGAWLPSIMPYYISPVDMSWLLNNELAERVIGYAIIVFESAFIFFCCTRVLRVPLLVLGAALHIGIIASLNIYPFGFGMLVHYALMVPFKWWRSIGDAFRIKRPLPVAYDPQTAGAQVIVLRHFDIFHAVEYRVLDAGGDNADVLHLGAQGTLCAILTAMRYTAPLGLLARIPAVCRAMSAGIAAAAAPATLESDTPLPAQRISRFFLIVLLLQLNSTVHYAILYRMDVDMSASEMRRMVDSLSSGLVTFSHGFLGITPHALYMHDHLQGYEHLLAISYRDARGREQYLPFVNDEGRLIAPNWGRVHSMWANVAVTANIDQARLNRFIEKVTAFWGTKAGLDLSNCTLALKTKKIRMPSDWEKDLRHWNLTQPWREIGTIVWKDWEMRVDLDDEQLEKL